MAFPSFAFALLSIFQLLRGVDWRPWGSCTLNAANASITFQTQFASIEKLAISSFDSTHITNDLRMNSLALEDLSYVISSKFSELGVSSEVSVRLYDLSKDADAVADALEQFYLGVTGMAELIPATSSTLEKLLRRRPSNLIHRLICHAALSSAFRDPGCRAHLRLPVTFQNHIDSLSSSLESLSRHMCRLNEEYHRFGAGILAIVSQLGRGDLADGGCSSFVELWTLSEDGSDELQASFRNRRALKAICSHLRALHERILDHNQSISVLEDSLGTLQLIAREGRIGDDPSLPTAIAAGLERVSALREPFVGRNKPRLPPK